MRIYVASSWRNARQPEVVERLRRAGHEVYDFRNPAPGNTGFSWREIDGGWQAWDAATYIRALAHPVAVDGFRRDFEAMEWADAFVLVHPSGRSAHLEAGWATGRGKPVFVLLEEHGEPELMLKQVEPAGGELHADLDALVVAVGLCAAKRATARRPGADDPVDVPGFDVPMSTVLGLMRRHVDGEPLTFRDGLLVAHAIGERLQDDLHFAACGEEDAESEWSVGVIADELVALTAMAYGHSGARDPEPEIGGGA